MRKINKKYHAIFSVALLVFSLLFCFLVGEIYLRILYAKEHNRLISKYKGRELYATHSKIPDLIYTYIPNKYGRNSHGYRDYEYNYSKDDRVYRIVIIGDSVAYGLKVKLEESFGKVLETKLNHLLESEKCEIEVIILALGGYSTSQELIILENEGLDYSPDLIIWSYVLNDPAHPVYHNANGEMGRYFFKPKVHIINFVKKKWFDIAEKIKGKNCEKEYHKFLHCVYWDQVESHINKIGQISKKHNIPIIFLIHPVFQKNKSLDTYTLTSLHRRLDEVASETGLLVLDLLDAYKSGNPDFIEQYSKTWFDSWHPNAEGHRLIADYIYKNIRETGYIRDWLIEIGSDRNFD